MRILHKSKRATPPHPQVAEVVSMLLNTSDEDLPDALSQIEVWKWPRSDLNSWIEVLNKLDASLENVINTYDVAKLQLKPFPPLVKRTVCEILRFERLLLENSTNRKMYSSYDQLKDLLLTSDLDVLMLTLNLLLRPCQQYSAQPAVSSALSISTSRFQSLVKRWPNLRDYGVGLVELVSSTSQPAILALPSEAREVNYSFYKKENKEAEKIDENMEMDALEALRSPARKSASSTVPGASGTQVVNVHLEERVLLSKEPMAILSDLIDEFSLPESDQFELLCRIRSATALAPGNEVDREKLVIIRLLAIAIFGHTHNETQATSSLFLYEPDLILHIAELLQLDRGVPIPVQTAAISALDALARYRNKMHEVLTAVNAGVNHGILMALVRRAVNEVADPNSTLSHSFADTLLSFVTYLATHAAGGNMVVGAGLIPLLIQIIENRLPIRLAVVSKTMQLVDNVLYSYTNAFQLFASAHGVEILVDRIAYEVDLDIKEYAHEQRSREMFGSYGDLPVARAAILKHILRSMHRMMQSSGTAEGLRGLIDTSILKSIKKVIRYRGLFGPSVLHIAINIMSTFVHNEPTSLAIIQEAGLPEAFYKAVESGLEPSIEIIQSIPNAIGALCLNQAGQDQLAARPSILPGIFTIFTSERHLKVLQDKENAVLIGAAIDELIRHHPSLKTSVFESLQSTLSKIEDLGNAYEVPEKLRQWYQLLPVSATTQGDDITMHEVESEADDFAAAANDADAGRGPLPGSEEFPKPHENVVVSFIDVLGRFLEGLFQHPQHCKDFLFQTDALDRFGRLTALPCLPYNFANSVASDSLVQVMRTMADASPNPTLPYLLNLVKESLAETRDFWGTFEPHSKLAPLVEITATSGESYNNQLFRRLVTLHIRITLLSDVFASAGLAHGRATASLLQTLSGPGVSEIMTDLGSLHRVSIWENIVLKPALVVKGIDVLLTPTASPLEQSPDRGPTAFPEADASTPNGVAPESSSVGVEQTAPRKDQGKEDGPKELNAKALKHLTHGLPSSLAPFFQATVKMFYARRNPDPQQKKQFFETAKVIARTILKHLTVQELGDHKLSRYTYHSVMLGLITLLILDDRTSQNTIHTVLLVALYRIGGLDAIFDICRQFMSSIGSLHDVKQEDRSDEATNELVHAYGGLKVALHLLHPLITSRPLFESNQTQLARTQDKQETDPEYFEPRNFIVRTRLAIMPLVQELWDSPWLVHSPLAMCRSVVLVVMELIGADSEESKPDHVEANIGGSSREHPAIVVPDENCVRQLTDMGFPRSAAERALIRARNNVNGATELLLSHPFPLPPDPEPVEDVQVDTTAQAASHEQSTTEEGTGVGVVPAHSPTATDLPVQSSPPPGAKTHEELRHALNEAREPLKAKIPPQALRLIDEHPSLIFGLHAAFVRPQDQHQKQAVSSLVEDIMKFSATAYDAHQSEFANRCRLLALVLRETPSSLPEDIQHNLINVLLSLLVTNPIEAVLHPPRIMKWLAPQLLVLEALFTIADQPRPIVLPKENEDIPKFDLTIQHYRSLPTWKSRAFDFCMRLLSTPDVPSDEFLSLLRLLVLLTRDHRVAHQFVQRDGIVLLFSALKTSSVTAGHSYVAIILRHALEDPETVKAIISTSLRRYFAQPRTHISEVGAYVRNCSMMALRDPAVFIDVTRSICQLSLPFSVTHHVSLKSDPETTEQPPQIVEDEEISITMHVDAPQTDAASSVEPSESIIHFMIGELIKSVRSATMPSADQRMSDSPKPSPSDISPSFISEPTPREYVSEGTPQQEHFSYSCLLMQFLTELLFSYESCKTAFLSYSPKKRTSTGKETSTKHRTYAINFLLSELIAFPTLSPDPSPEARNRFSLVNWAMSVVLALCMDPSSANDLKDVSLDLISVRKFVLEAVSRAIKEPPSSESVDARYGRLLALSELCHRMLTARFSTRKSLQDEIPSHMAKIMLEKHFVSSLTNALAEVDLNYPNVKSLLTSILRPLEHLSKIAIKMSRALVKAKDLDIQLLSDSSDSSDLEEDVIETGREETPDLYRNSALGMYGGEMDVHFNEEERIDDDDDDDDDDDEREEGDDVEMDFASASEDTDDTPGDDEGRDEEEGLDNEGPWREDEGEEVQGENRTDDGDEDDDEGDEDEDEDARPPAGAETWDNIVDANAAETQQAEEGDEDNEIVRTNPQDGSDADDLAHELGILDVQPTREDLFGLTATFANGLMDNGSRDTGGFLAPSMISRRQHDDNVLLWGRPRIAPTPTPEATTHPLLLDANYSSNRGHTNQPRGSRRAQRAVVGGELLRTIEDLLGGVGAVHLIQHFVTRGTGPSEAIRVDVPASTFVNFQRRLGNAVSTSLRVDRSRSGDTRSEGRDFDPLFTIQRWAEEIKILHGELVNERASTLCNYVVIALLPTAIETAKRNKQKEEEELAKARELKAKEEAEAAAKPELATSSQIEATTQAGDEVVGQSSGSGDTSSRNLPSNPSSDDDTEMVDAPTTPPAVSVPSGPAADGQVASTSDHTVSSQPGPSSSIAPPQPPQRITVTIHGAEVDITDTGIDPTFLEALPDEMREEVLNQHVRDQRAARVERPPDSQISAEFLDALPPELRAEIIQQERQEQARRDRAAQGQPARVPEEIDPASFIASLDPQLREVILMDQDDGFIQTLPSHMIAEAGEYRDGSHSRRHLVGRSATRSTPARVPARKPPPMHDAIQLVDKAGVAVLVRLLFFPQVLKKSLLFKLLVNICENAKTRTELFNLLLNILQDGTGDLAAVDKSFSQLSVRNVKGSGAQMSKSAGKQKASPDYPNASYLSNLQHDAAPEVVAQRCLEALTYIVTSNEIFSVFFLSEHELPAGLRRAASKKGKGKEKQSAQTHYPIVLLLGLLDRQPLVKTPSIMEAVVGLLATITRPLTSIKDANGKEQTSPDASQSPSSALASQSSASASPVSPARQRNPEQSTAGPLPSDSSPDSARTNAGQETQVPVVPPGVESAAGSSDENALLRTPPQIPHTALKLIVNILTIGDCSGRTFQQSLALIQHLSYIPDARDVVASELKSKAQEFGQVLYSDLDGLVTALLPSSSVPSDSTPDWTGQGVERVVGTVASKFSAASSEQAKLLRVLKTIDYMYSAKHTAENLQSESDVEKVQAIYESFQFTPLWRRLGDCLAIIEEKPDMEHIATVLLPLIEALMVVCKYVGAKSGSTGSSRFLRASASPRSPTTARESMEDLFITFTDTHRKVLNLMVRNNPSLMSGSFSLLVHNPRVLDFDNKRNYFTQQLHRRPHSREHHNTLQLNVRRARVFEDSFQHLQRKTGEQIKYGKLSIRFYDEEGVDAGGVTREWFQILARQMFDPNNALFQPCAADRLTYQPNKNSWVNPEHLSFFKFVGRVIGKAIYDSRLLDAYFARSLYRQLLGKPVDYKDVEWVDPEYYNSLCWILENDPTGLDLNFSVEADEFGVNRIIELKEGGVSVPVTQENKREFVQLSAQYRLYSSIKDQIENLLSGFYEIIPKDLVTIFNEQELELLISGTPDIDVDEWRAATEYNGYTSSDPVIVWWWRALKSFSRDERAKVLSFATGTSRVPLGGFVDLQGVQGVQRFSIHRAYGDPTRLPQAHTCFNQIDLPQYTSYEMLRQQLLLAIQEGSEGFGFA